MLRDDLIAVDEAMLHGVCSAFWAIRKVRYDATKLTKILSDGRPSVYSIGDTEAEKEFMEDLADFPWLGVLAEEAGQIRRCTRQDGHDVYVVLDSLDGSENYLCDDGLPVTVMAALVCDGKIVASYVVDTNSFNIVGYGVQSPDVFLWREGDLSAPASNLSAKPRAAILAESKFCCAASPKTTAHNGRPC